MNQPLNTCSKYVYKNVGSVILIGVPDKIQIFSLLVKIFKVNNNMVSKTILSKHVTTESQ